MNEILDEHIFYMSFVGSWIAIKSGPGNPYFSLDGCTFYELFQTGFNNGPSFTDPHHDRGGKIVYRGDAIVLVGDWLKDEPIFRPVDRPEGLEVVPLPEVRTALWLYKLEQVDPAWLFCGTGDLYRHSPDTVRIFGGPEDKLLFWSTEKYLTYGSLPYFEANGRVFNGRDPSWEGLTVVSMEMDLFEIVEDVDGRFVTVVVKSSDD
jgi:hypothetical protein